MKTKYLIATKDLASIVPIALALGALFVLIQSSNWLLILGWLSFSFIFLLSIVVLKLTHKWSNGGKTLGLIIVLAFFLRLGVGVTLHLALPVYGHNDEDDRAGYVFTDAHNRDNQAWSLAISDHPIIDAFSEKYASDQYGGLLAFNAFIYRYFSPDAQRPLMLILFSAFFAALGIPFLWKAVNEVFGEKVAWASTWISALYPESILLGASAMREPYLLTFSAFALWGFVALFYHSETSGLPVESRRSGWIWLGFGLLGMLLVSPAVALVTIIIFAGWVYFTNEGRNISWKGIFAIALVFMLGLFILSASLNRSSQFDATSPLHVINDWLKSAVKWDAYQLERDSGWIQKIFDEGPRWIRLPFIAIYGIFQPILPATLIHPTKPIWTIIGFLRGLGWYAILPLLILSFGAATGSARRPEPVEGSRKMQNLLLWLSLLAWIWILLASLRGGADLYDNPRYRTILFLWQSILAGYVWIWWRETRSIWLTVVLACEIVFVLVFTQWYLSRYYHWGGQLPFAVMIGLILGLWGLILGMGWWQDQKRAAKRA
ncbi:MAG TPA: hypothetical protein VKB04_10570 [Anaerolineales bacterium]|nr:hypothetical protein [Anaerolineales bacterium]